MKLNPKYRTGLLKTFLLLIVSSVVYTYFYNIIKHSINFSYADDYDTVLEFLNNFTGRSSSISDILLSLHNEHRPVFLRLIVLAYYGVFSEINILHLIVIGNLFIPLIIFLLFVSIKDERRIFLITPVFLLVLNYSNWEAQTWTTASLSYYPVLFFSFLSLYLIQKKESTAFALGITAAVFAVLSQGNGIFVFLAGILLIHKSKWRLILWLSLLILLAFFYFSFLPYQKPSHHPLTIFKADKIFLFNRIFYVFTLLSSVFHSKYILFLGAFPLLLILYIFKNYKKFSSYYLSIIVFLLITFASQTLAREGFGYEQAYSSRYQINTLLLYVSLYLLFIDKIKIKKHFYYILFFSLMFYFNTNIFNINNFVTRKNSLLLNRDCGTSCPEILFYPDAERAKRILHDAEEKGLFKP